MVCQTDGHCRGAWRAALPQAFMGHHEVVEAHHQPKPSLVAGTVPGQTAGAAPQGCDQPSQGTINLQPVTSIAMSLGSLSDMESTDLKHLRRRIKVRPNAMECAKFRLH